MTTDPQYRRNYSASFLRPDGRYVRQNKTSFTEFEWENEPILTTISPTTLPMAKTLPNVKSQKTWDSDKALKSTHKGLFGKYQLRTYLLLALGYGVIGAWLAEMPSFALLPPKYIDCTSYDSKKSNISDRLSTELDTTTTTIITVLYNDTERIPINGRQSVEPVYNYSKEYGRSVLTDFNTLCDKTRVKIPYILYIIGFILGGFIFGYIADHSGRKMILLGSMWTACVISIFQLLSEDYISYIFFMLFIGFAIGAVHVITLPYVMEMFPVQTRAIYALSLIGVVFLLDLIIPWIALGIKNWKILQAIVSVPLILTASLYWFMEESMFWYTSQKDYVTAILSLKRISEINGIVFENVFREAREFLRGKRSKGIQCDFQPLLRLQDIQSLGTKYPDFDMVDLQATTGKKTNLSQRILKVISGHDYYPTISTFYPTDFFRSPVVTIYLLIMCGLWLVSSLTEYSLEAPHLTRHLTDNFFHNYFYSHLIQIVSFIIAFPLVYLWGRRWPTFGFFLIAEVCLLGSVAVKLDNEQTRSAMLVVYFMGKLSTRAAFIVIAIYTCEIFPTGLRCTALGICYTFRLIGVALASPDVGEINDWMPRLIYGVLSLVLGSMALLLPETKTIPLPRTMLQIETIPTSISKTFRRHRSSYAKRPVQTEEKRSEAPNSFNDAASVVSGMRSTRPYDYQSTFHSIYELQDFGQYDTVPSLPTRYPSRRMDLNPYYSPYGGVMSELFRPQQSIAEDGEYNEDVHQDERRLSLQRRLSEQKRLATINTPNLPTEDVIILPDATRQISNEKQFSSDIPRQNQAEDQTELIATSDEKTEKDNQDEKQSPRPPYQRTMSQDENYFSEHC
ncbi:unnamed protein product [Rotaria sordida]|uniref:Major facilitator superfamily (MFS) profile domain-containing protein n=1 Tax=Rotaria sordida TaxID=392033 RepID=A0A813PP18_9BILA|nr:unnamed protein product [Rotaria sordida]